jgi:hypothetical protein
LAAFVLIAACGPGMRPALFWRDAVQAHQIDSISVLPAIDGRIDRSIDVDLDAQLVDETIRLLRERGYVATRVSADAYDPALRLDELAHADAATIKELAPAGRWVMVVGLVDVTTSLTFGSTGNAEVAGYLFDTTDGSLQWRDKGVGQVGQGGLLGMALIANMDEAAIADALQKMIAGIPIRDPGPGATKTPLPS